MGTGARGKERGRAYGRPIAVKCCVSLGVKGFWVGALVVGGGEGEDADGGDILGDF